MALFNRLTVPPTKSCLKKRPTERIGSEKKFSAGVDLKPQISKKRVSYDPNKLEENLNFSERTYGYKYVHSSSTPFPRAYKPVDFELVKKRLEHSQAETCDNLSNSKINAGNLDFCIADETSETDKDEKRRRFLEQRKRFDEGEFTITRGTPMSDFVMTENLPECKLPAADSEDYLQLIKSYAKSANIKWENIH